MHAGKAALPIGAVLVGPDGNVLGRGRNRIHTNLDPTCRAEIDVIRQAGDKLLDPACKHKCTLYTSVEPCPMCTGAIILADIRKAVWALSDDYLGAVRIMKYERRVHVHKGLQRVDVRRADFLRQLIDVEPSPFYAAP